MKIQFLQRNEPFSIIRKDFHSGSSPISPQVASNLNLGSQEFILKLLDRRWTLISPDTKIHQVMVRQPGCVFGKFSFSNNTHPSIGESMIEKNIHQPSFYVVRDDLLHPLVNGNKARKLDALLPLVEDHSVTDMVTCGGCQSAHTAAVAVSCAERGLKSHLLLRGEQPKILTGYNLISMLYGNVTYVPRSLYAKREEMLAKHVGSIAKGVIRLVQYLSQTHLLGTQQPFNIVVDAGTGTTAVGLAIGALCLGLPWAVTALMLADDIGGYKEQEKRLVSQFCRCTSMPLINQILNGVDGGIVRWVERDRRRKFGNVLEGEVEDCQRIAQQTGILVDPIYTLAAWELATQHSLEERVGDAKIVMIHTGGTLGMFGIAQRYPLEDDVRTKWK